MAEMDIGSFTSAFGSPAKPTLFKVQLNFPNSPNEPKDVFFCKGAQLPNRTVGMIELSYMGRKSKYAGDTTFDDWTVTIYNDVGFTIKRKLERWCELINETLSNVSADPSLYKRDLSVYHLDGAGNVLKTYKMIGTFPSSSGDPIDLGWDNNDSPEEYSVSFIMDYWLSDTSEGSIGLI